MTDPCNLDTQPEQERSAHGGAQPTANGAASNRDTPVEGMDSTPLPMSGAHGAAAPRVPVRSTSTEPAPARGAPGPVSSGNPAKITFSHAARPIQTAIRSRGSDETSRPAPVQSRPSLLDRWALKKGRITKAATLAVATLIAGLLFLLLWWQLDAGGGSLARPSEAALAPAASAALVTVGAPAVPPVFPSADAPASSNALRTRVAPADSLLAAEPVESSRMSAAAAEPTNRMPVDIGASQQPSNPTNPVAGASGAQNPKVARSRSGVEARTAAELVNAKRLQLTTAGKDDNVAPPSSNSRAAVTNGAARTRKTFLVKSQ